MALHPHIRIGYMDAWFEREALLPCAAYRAAHVRFLRRARENLGYLDRPATTADRLIITSRKAIMPIGTPPSAHKVLGVIPAYNPERDALEVFDEYLRTFDLLDCTTIVFPLTTDSARIDGLLSLCDGLLVVGGGDIEPRFHTDEPAHTALKGLCPPLDRMGIEVIRKAYRHGIPTLGTCRGMQIMNVALGGSLWQDLPSERTFEGTTPVEHQQEKPFERPVHGMKVAEGSLLASCIGADSHQVNSMHHQGVRRLAPCLEAVAWAPDGLVEGIEAHHASTQSVDFVAEATICIGGFPTAAARREPDRSGTGALPAYSPPAIIHPFFLGVQWHPEFLSDELSLQAMLERMFSYA